MVAINTQARDILAENSLAADERTVYERFLSIKDVADRLNISSRSVWRLIARCEFPKPVKIGSVSRFSSIELNAFIENLKQKRAK